MRSHSLTVAAAQPRCRSLDIMANAVEHASVIRAADARIVVFPELSLTGYELSSSPVDPDAEALRPIIDACATANSIALVGAPVACAGRTFITMMTVDENSARVAYCKTWLGGNEPTRFARGKEPGLLEIDGWRLGLGICKDTGAAQHIAAVATMDVDVYLAGLVHRPEELPEQEARAVVIARACSAFVVFASFAGATGDVFSETAGGSAIYTPSGLAISRAGPEPGNVVRAILR